MWKSRVRSKKELGRRAKMTNLCTKIVLLNEGHSVNQNQGENANSDHVSLEFGMAINKKPGDGQCVFLNSKQFSKFSQKRQPRLQSIELKRE